MLAKLTFQDVAAGLVSLVLTLGLVVLAAKNTEIPPALAMALGSATTWLFIRTSLPERPTEPNVGAVPEPLGLGPSTTDASALSESLSAQQQRGGAPLPESDPDKPA